MLPDPIPDRTLTDAQCPFMINRPIEDNVLFDVYDVPDWRLLKDFMAREGSLTKEQMIRLLNAALEKFSSESNLV